MHRSYWMLLLALGVGAPLAGCDQLKSDDKKSSKSSKDEDESDTKSKKKKKAADEESDSEEEEGSAKPTASASAAPPPPPPPSATAAPTDTAPTASNTAPPPPPPPPTLPGRSATPTNEEWNLAPELSVAGSTKLDCETKGVREWVRVSCKSGSSSRGAPSGVSVSRGQERGETFTFASGGVTSLVYPFYEGQDLLARFTWENHTSDYTALWPRGAPRPPVVGIFANTGAATPTTTATATATATTTTTKDQCTTDANCPRGKCKASPTGKVCVADRVPGTLKIPGRPIKK